jgi:D-alanyl-D-alanine carboxypeptidase
MLARMRTLPLSVCVMLAATATAGHARADPPTGLACMARHYAITATEHDGHWFGKLSDGHELAWDDGAKKSFDEALDHPDLKDMLARPYQAGALRPVADPEEDPGRVRVDALFAATYPESGVRPAQLFGRKLRVHDRVLPVFRRIESELRELVAAQPTLAPWITKLSGTFNQRNIAGTNRRSSHAYGISIDLDASRTQYWRWQKPLTPLRWQNNVPEAIVRVFERNDFIWGGRWFHYDTMHFEYRPELFDPACAPSP